MAREQRGVARLVGSIVNPVVESVDLDAVLSGLDLNTLLTQVDLNQLLAQVDLNQLLGRIDLNAVLARLDMDALLARIDPAALIDRIDPDALVARIDIDALVARVSVGAIVEQVDVDALITKVDVDALVQRVDVAALVDRVDVGALVNRVDVAALVDRVDVNGLVSRVDIPGVVEQVRIGNMVTQSATGVATTAIDAIRRRFDRLDDRIATVCDRILSRTPSPNATILAGAASRLAAYAIDAALIPVLFGFGVSVFSYIANLFLTDDVDVSAGHGVGWLIGAFAWSILYFWASWATSGRTIGMGVLGICVTAADGSDLPAGRALLRSLLFPFSFVLGLGFIGLFVDRERRALHDLGARSMVVRVSGFAPELPERVGRAVPA